VVPVTVPDLAEPSVRAEEKSSFLGAAALADPETTSTVIVAAARKTDLQSNAARLCGNTGRSYALEVECGRLRQLEGPRATPPGSRQPTALRLSESASG
jgi:hypothetical protein